MFVSNMICAGLRKKRSGSIKKTNVFFSSVKTIRLFLIYNGTAYFGKEENMWKQDENGTAYFFR
jgi:hypothetical protein